MNKNSKNEIDNIKAHEIQNINRQQKTEFNPEEAKHIRYEKRLSIIFWTINFCFIILIITVGVILYDSWKDEGTGLANDTTLAILITVVSTTLTTAVGVVIGSSID